MGGLTPDTFKIMENETAFDLNLAIRRWREGLAQSAAFRNENLNELESHLRDSINALQKRDLSEEEAFAVAIMRIGDGGKLETEFGKVNALRVRLDRFLWIVIAIQIWMVMAAFFNNVGRFASYESARLSVARGPYSEVQRNWITTSGPGAMEVALYIFTLLLPPFMLFIFAFLVWKSLSGTIAWPTSLMSRLIGRPRMLALLLFAACFGFEFLSGVTNALVDHRLLWQQFALEEVLFGAPKYLFGSLLILWIARKRAQAVAA